METPLSQMNDEEILLASLREIKHDFRDLLQHADDVLQRLGAFTAHTRTLANEIDEASSDAALAAAEYLRGEFQRVRDVLCNDAAVIDITLREEYRNLPEVLETCLVAKDRAIHALRTLQGIFATTIVSTDWQSPSFLHSSASQAGSQTGRITGTINDYKRDHHLDGEAYETAFARAYITAPLPFFTNVFLTSSGMSAFGTVINALLSRLGPDDTIIAGESCYFENKKILVRMFGSRVKFINEDKTDAFVATISEQQPAAVFLDSLCNSPKVSMPDVPAIFSALEKVLQKKCYVVLDNTGLASSFQPLKHTAKLFGKIRLVVLESLNKYHQFGFDRVTGGVFWTAQLTNLDLGSCRMHFGTTMPDASVLSLPEPNEKRLARRLERFERNATLLARTLQTHIAKQGGHSALSHIAYPGLPNHPAFLRTQDSPFHGSCLVLAFAPRYQKVSVYKKFLAQAIKEAEKDGIALCAGTSFGFDVTRVYLTALHATGTEEPFVRVSVGTESLYEIMRLSAMLCRVIDGL